MERISPQSCSWGCSAGQCLPEAVPSLTFTMSPLLIQKGYTVTVSWSTSLIDSCSITSNNSDSWTDTSGTKKLPSRSWARPSSPQAASAPMAPSSRNPRPSISFQCSAERNRVLIGLLPLIAALEFSIPSHASGGDRVRPPWRTE